MFAIIAVALLFFALWWGTLSHRAIIFTPALRLGVLGGGVLALPLLYTPSAWLPEAGWRVGGLMVGMLFYFSCLQIRYTRSTLHRLCWALLLLIAIQALLALLQLFSPGLAWVPVYGNRVYGIFRQPNVLASFIASGLALALMLLLLPGWVLVQARYERCRQLILAGVLLVLSALLVWNQSRAGWLGGIAVALLFLWCFGRRVPQRSALACGMMVLGVGVGLGVLWFADVAVVVDHEGSNHARWSMLRDTLLMISEQPWLGWGYGGYEYSFQHFRINQMPPTVLTEIARHPHNEILLWVAEGGLIALLGVVLILAAGLRVVRQAVHHDRAAFATGGRSAGLATSLCIAMVPIAIHSQLEYPFYLSTQHYLLLLLLLAIADRLGGGVTQRRTLPLVIGITASRAMAILALIIALVMGFSLSGAMVLNQAERQGLVDIEPLKHMSPFEAWIHQERKIFDEQVHALLTYNHSRDERLLEGYRLWAQSYLQRRIDKNVYASLIQILRHQRQFALAEQYRRDAVRLFPKDARFQGINAERIDSAAKK
ncbi:O-antigen ligase family protein [Serratia sp. (in: enterobacteria)]|uniref:O-antigen ligase family protein n=1 Tax=Serratia sp. (in: enterobacteria) TaxID=616 RepID=UPI00398A3AF1